jgi:hypothetical protein
MALAGAVAVVVVLVLVLIVAVVQAEEVVSTELLQYPLPILQKPKLSLSGRQEHLAQAEIQEAALRAVQVALPVSDRGLPLVAVTLGEEARQPVELVQVEAVSALLELVLKAGRVVLRVAVVRARLPMRGAAQVAQGVLEAPPARTLLAVTHVAVAQVEVVRGE